MLVLLDSNVFISALLTSGTPPAKAVDQWLAGRFRLLTCQHQIDEIRTACRYPKFRASLQPHHVGTMLNHLYGAEVWDAPLTRKHNAADPADSFIFDLIDAAQPDYCVTGDKRSGLLQRGALGRTKILGVSAFCREVLNL